MEQGEPLLTWEREEERKDRKEFELLMDSD